MIGTHLFNAALDLHTALATTNPQDVDAGVYAALHRLDDAITEIRTASHRQRQFQAASGR
ncbi:hypothetical protein [Amycolatopsis pigmentata]|uniref:Uncharacterized protein n=1 Tax=Amycolatopsis pigmentata TaxID=450801 RepID=A0ABW5G030_9PSEU